MGAKLSGQVDGEFTAGPPAATDTAPVSLPRPIVAGGDAFGAHRVREPHGALPQPALRLDNDFARLFEGETLIAVETLNIDAASFAQMVDATSENGEGLGTAADPVAHIVLRTVADRGKQHNPITDSGGMLLGRILQIAPRVRGTGSAPPAAKEGDRVATLVSLSLTPLRIDRVRNVRRNSAQVDVDAEAVLFESGAYAVLPTDLPDRVALAALDVAGAAPQVARLVSEGDIVLVLGAGGKSGVLCAAEARRTGGSRARIVGIESNRKAAGELGELGLCDAIVEVDARDALDVRRAVLTACGGREADVAFSCVSVPGAELAAILATRDRGKVYFFAMSTSFARAALGAEGVGKDVDLYIGNGFARGHADHTLSLLRALPAVRALFEKRYA